MSKYSVYATYTVTVNARFVFEATDEKQAAERAQLIPQEEPFEVHTTVPYFEHGELEDWDIDPWDIDIGEITEEDKIEETPE